MAFCVPRGCCCKLIFSVLFKWVERKPDAGIEIAVPYRTLSNAFKNIPSRGRNSLSDMTSDQQRGLGRLFVPSTVKGVTRTTGQRASPGATGFLGPRTRVWLRCPFSMGGQCRGLTSALITLSIPFRIQTRGRQVWVRLGKESKNIQVIAGSHWATWNVTILLQFICDTKVSFWDRGLLCSPRLSRPSWVIVTGVHRHT